MGRRRIVGSIIIIGSLVLIAVLSHSLVDLWHRQSIISDRKTALAAIEEEQRTLKKQLQEATGAAFIEKQAREKLGLVRAGETVVLMQNDELRMMNEGQDAKNPESVPNWKRWMRLFF